MFTYVHKFLLMQLPSPSLCEDGATYQPNTSSSDQRIRALGKFHCRIFCQNACNSFRFSASLTYSKKNIQHINITDVPVTRRKRTEISNSWNGTWAGKIKKLKYDGPRTSERAIILANYDPENAGTCLHII